MKVIMEFNLPEDNSVYTMKTSGPSYLSALKAFSETLQDYGNNGLPEIARGKTKKEIIKFLRAEFHYILQSHYVNLDLIV